MHIINDRLNTLGTYLKTKAFGRAIVWIGHIIGRARLLKIKKIRGEKSVKLVILQK